MVGKEWRIYCVQIVHREKEMLGILSRVGMSLLESGFHPDTGFEGASTAKRHTNGTSGLKVWN